MSDETKKRKFHAPPRRLPPKATETAESASLPNPKTHVHFQESNATKLRIEQAKKLALSQAQKEGSTVEMSEESCQTIAPSGYPNNGSPSIPLLLEAQVSLGAEIPLICNEESGSSGSPKNGSRAIPLLLEAQVSLCVESSLNCNPGSVSTTGILEKDVNVKRTREALLASLYKPKCSWGLIWRGKKLDLNTGGDFASRKVILKGNPHMCSIKPTCYYCSQPYNSDLMYIQCETCVYWYHADAVGLDEKKLSNLWGFKCCKCRRIKQPTCPYLAPEPRRICEVNKLQVKAPKEKNMALGPCPGSVQEQKDFLLNPAEEMPHTGYDDTLPFSSSQVQPLSKNNPQMDETSPPKTFSERSS